MWHSELDLIKDLASLNDFGASDDHQPYEVLLSNGRGSKICNTSFPKEFVDTRTGDIIEIDNSKVGNKNFCKGRGRGTIFGSLIKTKFQLEKQLRLARPLGSGDWAIESYCKRKKPPENLSDINSTTSGNDISEDQKFNLETKKHQSSKQSSKSQQRVKAIRSSTLQKNILLENLPKRKADSTLTEIKSFKTENGNTNKGMDFVVPSSSSKITETNVDGKNLLESSNSFLNSIFQNVNNETKNSTDEIVDKVDSISNSNCSDSVLINKTEETQGSDSVIGNERYRKLGEKLNKRCKVSHKPRKGNYFSYLEQSFSEESSEPGEQYPLTVIKDFNINDENFPSLFKN